MVQSPAPPANVSSEHRQRPEILGVPVDPVDLNDVVNQVGGWLDEPARGLRHVVTVNPEFVMAARRYPRFAQVLRESDLATADGVGIVLAAKLLGLPVRSRVTGVEMVEGIAGLRHENSRIFLLGAGHGVAAEATRALERTFPGVQIVGAFSGDASPAGLAAIRARLEEAKPTILLVAFGHPKQDLWISVNRERLGKHGILVAAGVGGAFDYLSGRVPRAPRLVRRLGFEWLYRLIRQPWRWRRQLVLPAFAILILLERLRRP
jgi:N-acetylglucosaminyldiphosphoundecaprenol N-acetyl-beta-D-mannosaminyltransferase